jgi:hypothetical protein
MFDAKTVEVYAIYKLIMKKSIKLSIGINSTFFMQQRNKTHLLLLERINKCLYSLLGMFHYQLDAKPVASIREELTII